MPQISTVERIRLNYSISTIATTVVYTFAIPTFATYFSTLWPHTVYFIIAELLKLVLIQKLYSLDVTYNQDGVRKRRSSKISEGFKFAVLMILVILSFMGIIFVLGASAFEQYEQTFTLSILLAGLTLFPISIFVGVSGTLSILFTESFELVSPVSQGYLKLLKRNAFLVIFGAFVGSAVFPLDWERPWQIFPIPNIVGAITAQMMGSFYCFLESMVKYKLGKKQR